MANNYVGGVIRLDTQMTGTYKSQPAVQALGSIYLRVQKIVWLAPSSAGTVATIVDPNSQLLASLPCDSNGISVVLDWTPNPRRWSDFELNQLPSGTIEIYLI